MQSRGKGVNGVMEIYLAEFGMSRRNGHKEVWEPHVACIISEDLNRKVCPTKTCTVIQFSLLGFHHRFDGQYPCRSICEAEVDLPTNSLKSSN